MCGGGQQQSFAAFWCVVACATIIIGSSRGVDGAAGQNLKVTDDTRSIFLVQPFCFSSQGELTMDVEGIKIDGNDPVETSKVGFVVMRAKGAYSSNAVEYAAAEGECLLDGEHYGVAKFAGPTAALHLGFNEETSGQYFVLFVNCQKEGTAVSFDLKLKMTNSGVYLPAGDVPLPALYGVLTVCFVAAGGAFIYSMHKGRDSVHRVHMLMAVLVFVKAIALGLEAVRLDKLNKFDDGYGWSTAFYIFSFLKGAMLFGILLLIGTGLFILKPFLNDKDKKIILVVLPLQCMVNVAMVVVEETPPGTIGWLTWRDILHLLDIICCCAILFPIVWSIRHLREAAHADGQASRNLGRLRLFREFYIMVVCYIYFTRIIVYLVRATLPCRYSWISSFTSELATLVFFVCVGWQFRPRPLNPYFHVDEGGEMEEMDSA